MSLEKITKSDLSIAWNVLDVLQNSQNYNQEQSTNQVLERFDSLSKSKDLVMGELVTKVSQKSNSQILSK